MRYVCHFVCTQSGIIKHCRNILYQVQNGILLPSLRPALPFLDLHAVARLDFHQSVMEELRERLLQKINQIADSDDKHKHKTLNDLLVKSFPVIKVSSLR